MPMNGNGGFKHTHLSLKVGRILLAERRQKHWNYDIFKRSGATSMSNTFFILKRFKSEGWVTEAPEYPPPHGLPRSARVLYSLTETGALALRDALMSLQLAST